MIRLDSLRKPVALRAFSAESELHEAINLLVGRAIADGLTINVIRVSGPSEEEDEYEIILWGD